MYMMYSVALPLSCPTPAPIGELTPHRAEFRKPIYEISFVLNRFDRREFLFDWRRLQLIDAIFVHEAAIQIGNLLFIGAFDVYSP